MSNYSRYKSRHTRHIDGGWWELIIIFTIALLLIIGVNACTAKEWNGGVCPDCNVRYELRGVYKGTRYYACLDCGNEISRYGGK